MRVTPQMYEEPDAAPAAAPAVPDPPRRPQLHLLDDERDALVAAMTARGPGEGVERDVGENTTFAFNNGITLKYNRGAQLYLQLRYPNNRLGAKIMTKERTQIQSDDEVIRQAVFDKATTMGPTTDFELAAVRDYVLKGRGLGTGTPGNAPAPPTPAPAPWPPQPPSRGRLLPRPTAPSGAAGSGLPR
jgi:hypothetical protein